MKRLSIPITQRIARLGFWVILLGIFYVAFTPVNNPLLDAGYDKVKHLFAFFVLSIYACIIWPRRWIIVFFGLLAVGLLIEFVQSFIPGRDMSALDVVADLMGILLGYLLINFVYVKLC